MFSTENVNVYYTNIQVLYDVSVKIKKGEVRSLLGLNGAGKTTFVKSCLGLTQIKSGKIEFGGKNITNEKTNKICQLGIGYLSEERDIVPDLSVREHLILANTTKRDFNEVLNEVVKYFPVLEKSLDSPGFALSGGEGRILQIAMALTRKPKLLFLDEPSRNLSPMVVMDLMKILGRLTKEEKVSIFLTEQNIERGIEISDKFYIIKDGRIVAERGRTSVQSGVKFVKRCLGF